MSKDELRRLSEELLKRGEYLERLARDPVPEITRHELDQVLGGNQVVFLFFTADWCGPCISFLETFRSVALDLSRPGVFFGRVDVDRSYSIAERYNIERIPAIAVFVKGRIVDVLVGSMGRDALKNKLRSFIERASSEGQ
jgi:thioredoxin 1